MWYLNIPATHPSVLCSFGEGSFSSHPLTLVSLVFLSASTEATCFCISLNYHTANMMLIYECKGRLGNQLSSLATMISFSGWSCNWRQKTYKHQRQKNVNKKITSRSIRHESGRNKISGERFLKIWNKEISSSEKEKEENISQETQLSFYFDPERLGLQVVLETYF